MPIRPISPHWSAQKQIPIMQDVPETSNVWAPETYWDQKAKQWLIVWSSSVGDPGPGNRIYSSLTPDFNTFSKPVVFFDPGLRRNRRHDLSRPRPILFYFQRSDA